MLLHTGRSIPRFDQRWDPYDEDIIWFAWDDALDGASITASTWVVPLGWTLEAAFQNQTVVSESGESFTASNGARLSTTAEEGTHVIANRVTLSDGRELERSVRLLVEDL